MMPHLIMDLEAPLMSFGSEIVGAYGPTRLFPGVSMVVGMLANALGWDWGDASQHDRLQNRVVMGSMLVRPGVEVTDYQTVRLVRDGYRWTTRGEPEGRSWTTTYQPDVNAMRREGVAIKTQTHQRWRDARADARVIVALRLESDDEEPTVQQLLQALRKPERPLFIGRKPFTPSRQVAMGMVEAYDVRSALWEAANTLPDGPEGGYAAQWPEAEGGSGETIRVRDLRNWRAGVHGGERRVLEGRVT